MVEGESGEDKGRASNYRVSPLCGDPVGMTSIASMYNSIGRRGRREGLSDFLEVAFRDGWLCLALC